MRLLSFTRPLAAVAVVLVPNAGAMTPEEMISANRYTGAQPNPSGVGLGCRYTIQLLSD